MSLAEALTLFRRLGVEVQSLSPKEFGAAYFRLVLRYHPDINPKTHDLMANINAARATILMSWRFLTLWIGIVIASGI
jgi:curved DNA-binding protein CbpA